VFCYGELQGYKMLRLGKCRAGSLRAQQSSMMVIRWACLVAMRSGCCCSAVGVSCRVQR
jgi:hypothetical protein